MSDDGSLVEAAGLFAPSATQVWGLARSRGNRHQGWVVAVDVAAGRAARARDFMEDYQYCGLCQHPASPQVAVVVGVHSGGTCRPCLDADNPARPWSPAAMCEHRTSEATLTLMDMRAPAAVDRCTLQRPSVFHRVATSPAREHFVFTSHQSTPVCAWDLRNMSYPVHQGRLDHSALPLPTTGLPQAVWHTNSKALFLSAHDDYLLGHAANGMMWHFDLSAMLGWASTARRTRLPPLGAARRGPDCREGCWLQHRSSSDAEPGQWTHPQPLGIVAGDISATQAVFPLPGGPCGGFITSGFCSAATTGSADALCARAEARAEARAASVAAEGPADTWAALARSAAAARPAAVPQERAAVRPGHMHGLLLFQLNGEAGA